MNVVKSEWIKLITTKSVWWTSGLIFAFSLAIAALNGVGVAMTYKELDPNDPVAKAGIREVVDLSGSLAGVLLFGVMIVIIQAVINVTAEYGTGTAKTTLLATPKRWRVPLAKVLIYGSITAIVTLLSAVFSVVISRWMMSFQIDDKELLDKVSLGADNAWTMIFRLVLYAVLVVFVSTGVGYLVRSTAAGIAILLLWDLVVEGLIVPLVPKIRDWLPPYMPFGNMTEAVSMRDVADAPWGQTGSVLYFAIICLAVFGAGVALLMKRDA